MGGRRAAMVLAKGRPPKGIKKAKEVTRVTCQEELTALMVRVNSRTNWYTPEPSLPLSFHSSSDFLQLPLFCARPRPSHLRCALRGLNVRLVAQEGPAALLSWETAVVCMCVCVCLDLPDFLFHSHSHHSSHPHPLVHRARAHVLTPRRTRNRYAYTHPRICAGMLVGQQF
jgi:hypothetical protein